MGTFLGALVIYAVISLLCTVFAYLIINGETAKSREDCSKIATVIGVWWPISIPCIVTFALWELIKYAVKCHKDVFEMVNISIKIGEK